MSNVYSHACTVYINFNSTLCRGGGAFLVLNSVWSSDDNGTLDLV